MNNEQFREEMHLYLDQRYDDFIKYQNIVSAMLDEFHRLCLKHGLPYCMTYGSLLGLVRDSGCIPWDYDIDVFLPYSYLEKLILALETDLKSEYYYVYVNKMKDYPTSCLRVCKRGYSYMALHVDVFFLIGCPTDKKRLNSFKKKIKWLYAARQAKCLQKHLNPNTKIGLAKKIYTTIKYPILLSTLSKKEKAISTKYPMDSCEYCTILFPFDNVYKSNSFDSVETICVDGKEYNIPRGYETFLREEYGDYMEYLPITSRFDEFYRMSEIIEKRKDVYDKYLKKYVE